MKDFILNLFISDDSQRPAMNKPGEIVEFVYASNGSVAVRIRKEDLRQNYPRPEAFPKAENVFVATPHNSSYIRVTDIGNCIAEARLFWQRDGCEKCSGEGEVECACCTNLKECAKCNGSGDGEFAKFPLPKASGYVYIKVGDRVFSAEVLTRLFLAACIVKAEYIQIFNDNADSKGMFCEAGPLQFIIMPIMAEEFGSTIPTYTSPVESHQKLKTPNS